MNIKASVTFIALIFSAHASVPLVSAFAPVCNTRSGVKRCTQQRSSTALDMSKPTPQMKKKQQLEATSVAMLIALTVATTTDPLSSSAGASGQQIVSNSVAGGANPPQVTVTPFGGGFGGIGLSPFGLNPFGGFGAGFGFRVSPRPQPLSPEQQLEAMKGYRAQMDARIKMMEQQQQQDKEQPGAVAPGQMQR